jgi:SOS response associated peptidase (SRAP)
MPAACREAPKPRQPARRSNLPMCGRYTLRTPIPVLAERFQLSGFPELQPRYNVTPTQSVPAVPLAAAGERELVLLRWGLVPSWADGQSIGLTEESREVFGGLLPANRRTCFGALDFFTVQRRPLAEPPSP